MKIPGEIRVNGHTIRVDKVLQESIDGGGEYRDYYNLIRLRNDSDVPESSLAKCFLHEIIECIKAKNGLEIHHTHLTVLSEGLFQVLRVNGLDFRERKSKSSNEK